MTVTSTQNGRLKIIEAANVRNDIVYQRLQLAGDDFAYHMETKWYRQYTLKRTLDYIKKHKESEPEAAEQSKEETTDPNRKKTRYIVSLS